MDKPFVKADSVVRRIWGKGDTVLFIFAGAAAEFALNKAVDWLYFTGRLPADPLERLFSTVTYAREIIFSTEENAYASIDKISAIHREVEKKRGAAIPGWAYRDVLFMLIDYSISSYELLETKLTNHEKSEVFNVFYRVGERMKLEGLPGGFDDWLAMRKSHLRLNLLHSQFTDDLYQQYRKHLGRVRFVILLQVQYRLAPDSVRALLQLKRACWFDPLLAAYKALRWMQVSSVVKDLLLPGEYKSRIKSLDVPV